MASESGSELVRYLEGGASEKLKDAIAAKAAAQAMMQRATEAHRNAMEHESRCAKRLAGFATLSVEIGTFTVDALRTTGEAQLSDELRERLQEKRVAETEHLAARHAGATLLREMSDATEAHKQKEIAQNLAMHDVVNVGRDLLRGQMAPLQAKVAAYEQAISWSDTSTLWQPVVTRLLDDPLNASLDVSR